MIFPGQGHDIDPKSLDLLQRVLLVSDGTLTDTLEAAFQEPIRLVKLAVDINPSRNPIDSLDLGAGALVMERRILLRGEESLRNFVYAESQVAVEHLPPAFRDGLLHSGEPIGRLWAEHRLETWKELLNVFRRPAGDLAQHFSGEGGKNLLGRTYRVFSGRRPVMVITEHFPETY